MEFLSLQFANEMNNRTITIAGGGIAGLTVAIALNKIGIQTTVFESSKEIKGVGAVGIRR